MIKRLGILLSVLVLAASTVIIGWPQRVYADPDCSVGRSLTIVAHPDDDLLFINPKIQQDIDAGKCVETVFVTGGAGHGDTTHMNAREDGIKAAYAYMAGESSTETEQTISIDGHAAGYTTVTNKPNISLVFLRIPELIKELWTGERESVSTIDSTASYTKQQLIDTLHSRMGSYQPNIIRTQNFTQNLDSVDHLEHTATAYFAQAAHYNYTTPHQLIAYAGYESGAMTANVSGGTLTQKQNAYFTYDGLDGTPADACPSITVCGVPQFLEYAKRNYEMATQTRAGANIVAADGDVTAESGVIANTGELPAAVKFGNDQYTFYYEASGQDLRYTKATSSSNPQWTYHTLDSAGNVGIKPSVVVQDPNGSNPILHVFYYRADTGDLRHAWLNGSTWALETLDGNSTANGRINGDVGQSSTAAMYGTSLQLFYYSTDDGNLRHAWTDANGWHFEDFDGSSTVNGRKNATLGSDPVALVHEGYLQLFYYDETNGNLRHVYENNGWHFEDLDGDATINGRLNADVGLNPAAVSYLGTLQVFYYDRDNKNLRHAWADANGWHYENLEGDSGSITRYSGDTGITPSAAIKGDDLHVFSYDATGSLRHTWVTPTQGWQAERLDTGNVGQDPSAIVYGDKVHVFYYDAAHTNLRRATF